MGVPFEQILTCCSPGLYHPTVTAVLSIALHGLLQRSALGTGIPCCRAAVIFLLAAYSLCFLCFFFSPKPFIQEKRHINMVRGSDLTLGTPCSRHVELILHRAEDLWCRALTACCQLGQHTAGAELSGGSASRNKSPPSSAPSSS